MAKRKKTIIAGDLVLVSVYPMPYPRDKEHVRAAKAKMSTKARRAMNLKASKRKLELLLSCNFSQDDLFVTLTYDDRHLPGSRKDAVSNLRLFLRRLRIQRKKQGKELRYVYVTENKHGEGRLHHHLVINCTGEDETALFRSLWEFGENVDVRPCGVPSDRGEYMTKEAAEGKAPGAQLWTGSRNLQRPEEINEIVPDNETVKCPPNAVVLERLEEQNEYGEFIYIKYRLLPVGNRPVRPSRRKKQNHFILT